VIYQESGGGVLEQVLPYCWLKQRLDCAGVHFPPLEGVVSGPKVCSAGSILPPDER
jgi:hypothetical protein